MPQSATPVYRFSGPPQPLQARFDGGRLTSDGGLPWLEQAEQALGLCAAFAAVIPDWRRGPVRHSLESLVRQRVFQIACGYEDQNDADTLRTDPLLSSVCGHPPESDGTCESAHPLPVGERGRSAGVLPLGGGDRRVYPRERERDGAPTHIVLDIDGTDDPTHGQQEGSAYHGYYRQHMLHLLLIFDGETHQPSPRSCALATPTVCRGQGRAQARGPRHPRLLAGRDDRNPDGPRGRCWAIYDWCESEGIAYTIGLTTNPRLTALLLPAAEAQRQRAATGARRPPPWRGDLSGREPGTIPGG
ncbi:MAG: transposase [Thermomicrobiales bacterium]